MMTQRDDKLLALRPVIPALTEKSAASPAEQFQNDTLRPILKLQNELLLRFFKNYIAKRKNVFYQLPAEKRPAYIAQSIRKDLKFRNFLVGMVAGHFTEGEWQDFEAMESELTRRIANLIIQRLCDQLEKL